ncbi:MAG TPA: P1 family peptidase [Actinomycetes bacterium]|nr:P1 family peptidase [Actinomycetes bacterium]
MSPPTGPPPPRPRSRDLGVVTGRLPTGPLNLVTDVPGVRVGHTTVWTDGVAGGRTLRTGVTALWPHDGNPFTERVYAATSTFNGYGVLTGDLVVDEWGLLGSPVVLCDTANLGIAYDAVVRHLQALDPAAGRDDVVMPVVGECDDGFLNDNRARALTEEDVVVALTSASAGPVALGAVGAGTGMQLFDYKGGIGSASRVVRLGDREWTVGVLLNGNFGTRPQLRVGGVHVGPGLTDRMPTRHSEGSCIAVVATDLPLLPHQLRRLARRVDVGLGRLGSVGNDGSGEIFLAFSTAQRVPRTGDLLDVRAVVEGQYWTHGSPLDDVFDAVAEAAEEATLDALFVADTVVGRDGNVLHGLPVDEVLPLPAR